MSTRPTRPSPEALAEEILRQTAARGPASANPGSICPSEVARALAPEEHWRSLMTAVRQAALKLQAEGRVEILRKGKPVPAEEVRGVIRLRAPAPAA
ncbi:DUF3253 domain-containing protein [Roseomonas sp. GC11]|uniref:DUF3253 domain-containing protein n=1 Tax=Roseomonas sp. GC11 TaxID=2950546 RepID=UPI00210888E6|nr:DUF3253 domain-containing protein [Roseomonas sp. GC11]MCQ4159517.1 DUF3253 domain-containing protein [Roseomonas sp. GC11]